MTHPGSVDRCRSPGSHAPRARRLFSLSRIHRETFVRHVDYHRTLSSTNDRAMELAADPATPLPAMVLTELQTRGRGRGANTWWSAPGALTFSLVLDGGREGMCAAPWPQYALAAAVGICEALEGFAPERPFGIRWPNDVCLGRDKICGILPEILPGGARMVLGIGININNSIHNAPEQIRGTAISLKDAAGRKVNLTHALVQIVQVLQARFEQLATRDPELPRSWRDRCLLRGQRVRLTIDTDHVEGLCAGIDAQGALQVRTRHGMERFYGGTVRLTDGA